MASALLHTIEDVQEELGLPERWQVYRLIARGVLSATMVGVQSVDRGTWQRTNRTVELDVLPT